MKMTMRWFGKNDPVTLDKIRQVPLMSGIVSAVYDVPVGEVWPEERVQAIKTAASRSGLAFEVVESVPVHEDIKLGTAEGNRYINNYCENIRRLGRYGVKVICYNFMPVFDWLRTELSRKLPDNSEVLAYDDVGIMNMNPAESDLSLPGWDESYTKAELQSLLQKYERVDAENLWRNLETFLRRIIPVAEESGVKMAIHPDDPPWGLFGLPRIITNQENIDRLCNIYNTPANGLTFCTGSLGAAKENELPAMIRHFEGRIHFAHLRNVLYTAERSFEESAHPSACGSLDMFAIVRALYESGFDGYIRPDHGRMIWGETGRFGYGLYDRALGATYLLGLWEAVQKSGERQP